MGLLEGKVAFISGAARGQGRAHAVRMAEEGADIIGFDILEQMSAVWYPMGTQDELEETKKQVENLGRKMHIGKADVRDVEQVKKVLDEGTEELGTPTIVVANAGIGPGGTPVSQETTWDEVIGVNLTGVWNTGRITIPRIIKNEQGGSVILTSSTGGLMAPPSNDAGLLGYGAAKHGVIGLMRSWANYCAPHFVRVNGLAPTTVATPMANNGDVSMITTHAPHLANSLINAMPVMAVEALDIANAGVWLASDQSRYVTGTVIPVDAGSLVRR